MQLKLEMVEVEIFILGFGLSQDQLWFYVPESNLTMELRDHVYVLG